MKILDIGLLSVVYAVTILYLSGCTERGVKTSVYTETAGNGSVMIAKTIHGKELYQQKCMACHGVSGSARNNNAVDLSLTHLDSLGIVTTIMNGRGTMPPFKDGIPDSEIAQIAIYVRTLRTK